MLGHKMVEILGEAHDVWSTVRGVSESERTIGGVNALEFSTVAGAIRVVDPTVVVNCVGVIKQRPEAKDPLVCHEVNTLLPHRIASLCAAEGRRLVHVSTDCVFAGRKGLYVESDLTDAEDLYGRSKALGEVLEVPHVTLRTSIIGRELRGGASLRRVDPRPERRHGKGLHEGHFQRPHHLGAFVRGARPRPPLARSQRPVPRLGGPGSPSATCSALSPRLTGSTSALNPTKPLSSTERSIPLGSATRRATARLPGQSWSRQWPTMLLSPPQRPFLKSLGLSSTPKSL